MKLSRLVFLIVKLVKPTATALSRKGQTNSICAMQATYNIVASPQNQFPNFKYNVLCGEALSFRKQLTRKVQ